MSAYCCIKLDRFISTKFLCVSASELHASELRASELHASELHAHK